MLWLLGLIAALVTPHSEARGPLPPRSYELALTVAYADAAVSLNGVPMLEVRAGARQTHTILLNAFLKTKANALEVTLTPAFAGHEVSGGLTVRSYVAGAGPESITTELERQITGAFNRQFDFDAPETPALAVWSAEEAALDDAARAAIGSQLAAFQRDVIAGLEARDAGRLISFFAGYPGSRDAARFLAADGAGSRAAMMEELAPVVNDPAGRGIAAAPPPAASDLQFRQAGRFVIASRKDGTAVLGFTFRGDRGPGGMTLDRPVLGRVKGQWVILQNIPLPRS